MNYSATTMELFPGRVSPVRPSLDLTKGLRDALVALERVLHDLDDYFEVAGRIHKRVFPKLPPGARTRVRDRYSRDVGRWLESGCDTPSSLWPEHRLRKRLTRALRLRERALMRTHS